VRLLRVLVVFALGGWIAGGLVVATNADTSVVGGLTGVYAFRSALAGLAGGVVWGPLMGWARLRGYFGAVIGLVAGLTSLYLFFFLWPPSLQAGRLDAWKTAGLFVSVYWRYLIPVSVVAGAVACEWARRPVAPPRWQTMADDEATAAPPERAGDEREESR
jgi:hypothetical protein